MKYRGYLLILLTLAVLAAYFSHVQAAEITVKKICFIENDLSARTKPRKDFNGTNCALVKLYLPFSGVRFQGNVIGNSDYYGDEYWVYLTEGTKELRVIVPGQLPTNISFVKGGIGPVVSGCVYEIYFCSINEQKGQYTMEDFQKAICYREELISRNRYDEAIKSLLNLRDSISSVADNMVIRSIDERIDFCKRQLSFKSYGFSEIGSLSYGRVGIEKDGKYGFADSVGNIIVYPQFEDGIDFNNKVAWVRKNKLWGNINLDGSVNVPIQYEFIVLIKERDNPACRWIEVSDGKSVGIVDYVSGKTVHPFHYSCDGGSASFFCHTLAGFIFGGDIGVASKDESSIFLLRDKKSKALVMFDKSDCSLIGKLSRELSYEKPLPFNLFMTKRVDKNAKGRCAYGIVDNMGHVILDCDFQLKKIIDTDEFILVSPVKSEYFWSPERRIFSLKTREFISEDRISYVDKIWNNWFVTSIQHREHYKPNIRLLNMYTGEIMDTDRGIIGVYEIPEFDDCLLLESYYSSDWYIFHNDGTIISLPDSEYSYYMKDKPLFQFGVQPILKNGKWGFVNINGTICIEPIYDHVSFFTENNGVVISEVSIGEESFIIDIEGNRIK